MDGFGISISNCHIINELIRLVVLLFCINIHHSRHSGLRLLLQLRLIFVVLLIVSGQLVNELNVLRVQADLL